MKFGPISILFGLFSRVFGVKESIFGVKKTKIYSRFLGKTSLTKKLPRVLGVGGGGGLGDGIKICRTDFENSVIRPVFHR